MKKEEKYPKGSNQFTPSREVLAQGKECCYGTTGCWEDPCKKKINDSLRRKGKKAVGLGLFTKWGGMKKR